jgi:hypothetical protein
VLGQGWQSSKNAHPGTPTLQLKGNTWEDRSKQRWAFVSGQHRRKKPKILEKRKLKSAHFEGEKALKFTMPISKNSLLFFH